MNEEKEISERYKENVLHLCLFAITRLISFGVWDEPTLSQQTELSSDCDFELTRLDVVGQNDSRTKQLHVLNCSGELPSFLPLCLCSADCHLKGMSSPHYKSKSMIWIVNTKIFIQMANHFQS